MIRTLVTSNIKISALGIASQYDIRYKSESIQFFLIMAAN